MTTLLFVDGIEVLEPSTFVEREVFLRDYLAARLQRARSGATAVQRAMMSFALAHDWGYDVELAADAGVRVGCDCVDPEGVVTREYTTVYTMPQLRDWAGY